MQMDIALVGRILVLMTVTMIASGFYLDCTPSTTLAAPPTVDSGQEGLYIDFVGDSSLDFVSGSSATGYFLRENVGYAWSANPIELVDFPTNYYGAWVDIDLDGSVDFVYHESSIDFTSIYWVKQVNATFSTPVLLVALDHVHPDRYNQGFRLYDVNIDGIPDLILTRSFVGQLPYVYQQTVLTRCPSGDSICDHENLPLGEQGYGYTMADLDDDGDLDLLYPRDVPSSSLNDVVWIENPGAGANWTEVHVIARNTTCVRLESGNYWDTVGTPDVVCSQPMGLMWRGVASTGTFVEDPISLVPSPGSVGTVPGGPDNFAELYSCPHLYRFTGNGSYVHTELAYCNEWLDLDDDGDFDSVDAEEGLSIRLGSEWLDYEGELPDGPVNSYGPFTTPDGRPCMRGVQGSCLPIDSVAPGALSFGAPEVDYFATDESGFPSPVQVNGGAEDIAINFSGGQRLAQWQDGDTGMVHDIALHDIVLRLADIDGDDDPDAVLTLCDPDCALYTVENLGNGTSWGSHTLLWTPPTAFSDASRIKFQIADLNGNGIDDVVVFTASVSLQGPLTLILDGGSEVLASSITTGSPSRLGDFNGDGRTDLLAYVVSSGGSEFRLVLGNGSPSSLLSTGDSISEDFPTSTDAYVTDFDSDGKTDVALFSGLTQYWTWSWETESLTRVDSGPFVDTEFRQSRFPTVVESWPQDGHSVLITDTVMWSCLVLEPDAPPTQIDEGSEEGTADEADEGGLSPFVVGVAAVGGILAVASVVIAATSARSKMKRQLGNSSADADSMSKAAIVGA